MEGDEDIWPPAPNGGRKLSEPRLPRKYNHGCLATGSVVFVTLFALFLGLGAGLGHKDFSESLLSNAALGLVDMALWVVAIFYWVEVAGVWWRNIRQNPNQLKYAAFLLFFGALAVLYGAGVYLSLLCLIARAWASDTTF